MFWFVFYFLICYGAQSLILVAVRRLLNRSKASKHWKVVVYTIVLIMPLLPYAKVAILTALYKHELLPAFRAGAVYTVAGNPNDKIYIFRVLNVSASRAEVYAVDSCQGGMGSDAENDKIGWVMRLTKTSKGWKFADYDAVWSDCGSAGGNTFPPYPEASSF